MSTVMLWQRHDLPGQERCVVERTPDGHRISGTCLVAVDGAPFEIRYSVLADRHWRTRTVGAHVSGPEADRRMALTADGSGSWSIGDEPFLDLYGTIDIDLAWTPSTNTLPIRRLGLEVGESAEIAVAMIDFPGHEVGRSTQRYTRLDADRYRFESGDFAAELVIGAEGLVSDYAGLWSSLAWSAERPSAASTSETSHNPENS